MRPQPNRTDSPATTTALEWPLLEHSTVVAALLVAPDGTLLGANARMRGLLGLASMQAASGRTLRDFLADREDWSTWQQAAAANGPATLNFRSAAGNPTAMRGDVRTVRVAGARVSCGVFVDADDRQQLRTAVQQSARMEALGSLTAGIAHDFNNLLTVLVGNLYLVAEELRDRPKAFERLKAARDAAKRGADLIKQLLTFARREPIETEVIDPSKVVGDVVPLLKRALGSRITLATDLETDAGKVRASTAQLESVIVNLAVNARDAIASKGTVTISVRRERLSQEAAARAGLSRAGEYAVASVADDGSGIPEAALQRVFEPFFSTKRERGGTGLGLSMVRWFAEQAGGAVRLDSAAGRGTTVAVFLPCCADEVQEPVDGTMPLSTLPTGTERIVVLAPDEALRSTIRQILEVLGYAVTFTAVENEMLDAVQGQRAELLIVDGPARDDDDLIARAKGVRPGLKVILTTEGARAGAMDTAGASALLAKPFTLADLAGTVRRALDAGPPPAPPR